MPQFEPEFDWRCLRSVIIMGSLFVVGGTWWCQDCYACGFEPEPGQRRAHRAGCPSRDAR